MTFFNDVPPLDWITGILLLVGLAILVTFAEVVYKKFILSKEDLRKGVHILSGAVILITPFIFQTSTPLLILSIVFAFINLIAVYTQKLNSYNSTERKSLGTFYYPAIVIVLTVLFWDNHKEIFMISFALLAFADAAAGLVGKTAPDSSRISLPWDSKSFRGSVTMFISSLVIVTIGLVASRGVFNLHPIQLFFAVLSTAALATAGELLSYRGSDNLSIPILAAISLYVFQQPELQIQFIFGFVLALIVVFLAYYLKALDLSGALATFILGTVIFGYGGWLFTIPILMFFIVSSALSHIPKSNKAATSDAIELGARRNVEQVFANGLLPFVCVIASFFYESQMLFVLYLGALSAATADTWATEIGLLSRAQPRSITTGKHVTPGMSGGITVLGSFGAVAGATFVTLIGYVVSIYFRQTALTIDEVIIIIIAGVIAQFIDSLTGALWQRKNRCAVCNKITERSIHCEKKTELFRGQEWLDNNVVNLICGFSGLFFINLFNLLFN